MYLPALTSANTYTIESNRLPEEFDGFRIAQISDLHNVEMGKNNQRLIEKLKTEKHGDPGK